MAWSRCTALDPPRDTGTGPGITDACGELAPYLVELSPMAGDPMASDCRAWLCAEHAARFRADSRAVRRLTAIRTNPTTTGRSTERP